ncbi:MAG TPA: Trm112 family protein [Terracidiphilus sp.]|nr:Trm112 family protein [Terracidiphilus sp.]
MNTPPQSVTGIAAWARELACPVCFSALQASADTLTCTACHRTYPITNGIPILIPNRSPNA